MDFFITFLMVVCCTCCYYGRSAAQEEVDRCALLPPSYEACADFIALGHSGSEEQDVRYYYDVASGRCEPYSATSCPDRADAYLSDSDCYRDCRADDVCRQTLPLFPCRAARRTAWYYDPATMLCKTFNFARCAGIYNNFETVEECTDFCNGVTGETQPL